MEQLVAITNDRSSSYLLNAKFTGHFGSSERAAEESAMQKARD
jgi:hypothetical protein